MADISITGLAANDPVPGEYNDILFAQGPASGGTATYAAILVGGMLSTGNASAATVYGPATPVTLASEADAIGLFGAGSELHRMFVRFTTVNQVTPLFAIAVAEGGSAAASTGTITLTTASTGAATLRIFVADQFVDTGIATGDTPTTIAAAAAVNINGKTAWPVTASASAGVITLTSKQKGLRANFIRYFAQIKPAAVGTTVTPTASTLQAGGTVSDSNATALAAIVGTRYYYVVSAAEDATQTGAALAQINTQSLPTNGLTGRLVVGSQDIVSNALSIAQGLNGARAELVWLYQSDVPPCELAAMAAAAYTLEEANVIPLCNFDGYGNSSESASNWRLKAPLSGQAPTRSQFVSALNGGVTPIGVLATGATYIVSRITTRSLNGSTVDYRIRDSHKVTICDRYADDLKAKETAQLSGKNVVNDPGPNDADPGPNCVSPRNYRALINRLTRDYDENGLLQNVATIVANTQVSRNSSPTTRMSALIPLQPVDVLHQIAASIQQVA
jgi:phage tail sheath gpL-like